jgi:hypothetical protein
VEFERNNRMDAALSWCEIPAEPIEAHHETDAEYHSK